MKIDTGFWRKDGTYIENYKEVSGLWRYQRLIAEFKIKKMIKLGLINKLNYLKESGVN